MAPKLLEELNEQEVKELIEGLYGSETSEKLLGKVSLGLTVV